MRGARSGESGISALEEGCGEEERKRAGWEVKPAGPALPWHPGKKHAPHCQKEARRV